MEGRVSRMAILYEKQNTHVSYCRMWVNRQRSFVTFAVTSTGIAGSGNKSLHRLELFRALRVYWNPPTGRRQR
jgi:hypothetical protein